MGKKVLLVDDMKSIRKCVARILRPLGFSILEADSAESALKLAQTQTLDMIISDVQLGDGMSGVDLAYVLRKGGYRMPIILMSGGMSPLEERGVIDLIATGVVLCLLEKPFDADKLIKAASTSCLSL